MVTDITAKLFPKGHFCSDVIEQILVSQRPFQLTVLERNIFLKNILAIYRIFFHFKEHFVQWEDWMDVKARSHQDR